MLGPFFCPVHLIFFTDLTLFLVILGILTQTSRRVVTTSSTQGSRAILGISPDQVYYIVSYYFHLTHIARVIAKASWMKKHTYDVLPRSAILINENNVLLVGIIQSGRVVRLHYRKVCRWVRFRSPTIFLKNSCSYFSLMGLLLTQKFSRGIQLS